MIETEIQGHKLIFETNDDVFSPSSVDRGTLAMLSAAEPSQGDKLLDLGCGYGVVGIFAAHVINPENIIMCDISENAVKLAKTNAELNHIDGMTILKSDGFEKIHDDDFTLILSNPPYHTDFSVAKHFIEEGYKRLKTGGKFIMVTKRLEWYKNKITSVFGGVKMMVIDDYFVFMSEKRNKPISRKIKDKNNMSKKLKRKYYKILKIS